MATVANCHHLRMELHGSSNTDRGLGHCGEGPGRFIAATGSGILYIHLIAVDSVARADSKDGEDGRRTKH